MKVAKMFLNRPAAAAVLAAAFAVSTLAAPASAGQPAGKAHVQNIALTIAETGGIDRVSGSSENFAIAPGVPVRITVTNRTNENHTFTVPALHVSVLIPAAHGRTAKTTTFTFTAYRSGSFAWYCAFCMGNAHGHPHLMGGTIYAIVDPAALA
jgi:FtsP/CotA-like multicopper oxidase with cupredoxin domain